MKKLQFIEVKSELGAGTRGASMAVEAIKMAAIRQKSSLFAQENEVLVQTEYEKLLNKIEHPFAKRIEAITKLNSNLSDLVAKINREGKLPVSILGDHSSSMGTVSGVKKAFPGKTVGVIWIDAHADIHSPFTTPSGNMHGMPMAALLGEDNMANKVNLPNETTIQLWEELKLLGGTKRTLMPEHLVYVGVRDTEAEEDKLIEKLGIKNYNVGAFREIGAEKVVSNIVDQLQNCDLIHISFDVDSLDPTISSGTGTPAPGGFEIAEAKALINGLIKNLGKRIAAFEVVEVNPILDTENKMANIAFDILQQATDLLKHE